MEYVKQTQLKKQEGTIIMTDNENLVTEVTENVETATEETVEQAETPAPRTYTQEEVDEIVSKRKARTEAKIRKEYDRKYGRLESVLKAGTGKESVEEMPLILTLGPMLTMAASACVTLTSTLQRISNKEATFNGRLSVVGDKAKEVTTTRVGA